MTGDRQSYHGLAINSPEVETASSATSVYSRKKSLGRHGRNPSFLSTLKPASNPHRHSRALLYRGRAKVWKIAILLCSVAVVTCSVCVVFLYLQVDSWEISSFGFHTSGQLPEITSHIGDPKILIFHRQRDSKLKSFSLPVGKLIDNEVMHYGGDGDYGDLSMDMLADDGQDRQIYRDFELEEHEYRSLDASRDDDMESYYDFDDDILRGIHADPTKNCRRMSEHELSFPNCNYFHEQNILEQNIKLLGSGFWRQVFGIDHYFESQVEKIVLKILAFEKDGDYESYETIRMDAIVAERLSSCRRTYEIYGFCGFGIQSEYFYHGDIEESAYEDDGFVEEDISKTEKLEIHNMLTGKQKLVLALEMAEGVAFLHGYNSGVIVHDDIQVSQFLLNKDKTMLKINDFNRAEFMLYDETEQQYCKYRNGVGRGYWRSPEEYKDAAINEKIDVWSLGNNFYTLLTGMNVFPWLEVEKAMEEIKAGNITFIDPRFSTRSREEAKLVAIIKKCFVYDPEKRPSVFQLVAFLREAVSDSLGNGQSRADVLRTVPV